MKRAVLRRGIVACGVIVVLALAVIFGLPLLVSGEQFRAEIQERLTAATGAEVSLGETRLRVVPRLALRVGPSRISGTGAGLRAAQGHDHGIAAYAVDLAGTEVRVGLLPLLQQRLEVGELRFEGTELAVVHDGKEILVRDFFLTVRDLEANLGGAEPVPAAAPPGQRLPADLACRADLRAGELTVDGARYEDVAATARLAERTLAIDDVTVRRGTGRITGEADVDFAVDPWGVLTFSCRADAVPAGDLLAPLVPDLATRLEGALSGSATGSCRLRDEVTILNTLDLAGTAAAGDGILHAGDWLEDVSSYLGDRQDLKDVRFRGLDHTFRIAEGRYLVDELTIDGLDTSWRGEGWIGLQGAIDLALHVKLPAGFTPDLGQWSFLADLLRDDAGRVQLDLRLTGRTARPAVSVDLSRLKEAATRQEGETLRQGVRSLLDKWKTK